MILCRFLSFTDKQISSIKLPLLRIFHFAGQALKDRLLVEWLNKAIEDRWQEKEKEVFRGTAFVEWGHGQEGIESTACPG